MLLYFIGSLVRIPPSLQDIAIEMVTTATIGYTAIIHIKLFEFSPILVVLPSLLVLFLAHFLMESQKEAAKIKLAKVNPLPSTAKTNLKKRYERNVFPGDAGYVGVYMFI